MGFPNRSLAGMIAALDMARQVGLVEIDRPQISRRVALRFVVEVRRARMTALAAGGHRPGAQARAELDHGDEAVAAGAVPAPRAWISARGEGSERAPAGRGERHGDAGPVVGEGLDDRRVVALEAVHLAPTNAPTAPLPLEAIQRA